MSFENNRASGPIKSVSLNGDYLQRTGDAGYDVSVSFWIKTSTNDANKRVIIDHSVRASEAQGASETGWYTYLKNGKVGVASNFKWYHANNTSAGATGYIGWKDTESTSVVSDDQWHHVVVVIDSYAGNWVNVQYQRTDRVIWQIYNVYVDGSLQTTESSVRNVGSAIHPQMRAFTDASIPVTVGNSRGGNSTNVYQELIDDLRFYNIPVDAAAVTQLAAETACSGTSGISADAKDITIELDAEGNASITTDDIDDGSEAVCGEPFTLSLDVTDFTCDDLGFNVVTLTATETFATQATSTATATVTVTYTPDVNTQHITVQLDESGNATITPADVDDGSATTGLCGDALTLSLDKTTFTCDDLGSNLVTLTSEDSNGNSGTGQASVTIEDNLAPVVVTQDIIANVDAALGFVTIDASQIDDGSSDNCSSGALTMTLSKTKFTCEDTGDNVVTLTVEDELGNVASSEATVTITSEINDETVTSTNTAMCPDGTASSTISTGSSVVGFNYTLIKESDGSVIDGPTAGTGSALDFVTGNLSETTKFNIIAEKDLTSTQSALDFDGVNDYVDLSTDARGISTQVTASAWIKTSTSGVAQIVINKYNGVNGYHIIIATDGYAYMAGRDGGGYKSSGNSTTAVNDGEWHHVAGSINVSTGVWSVYVDGVLESSASAGAGTTLASPATLTIGAYSTLYFTGEMDQVTIWDTALDAASIASNMNTCMTGSETNVVGHYIFEDGSGTTLTDQSASALDGTLTNMDGATDWTDIVSPSCGGKACDYQLETEVTIGDIIPPTAVADDVIVTLSAVSGEATVLVEDIGASSTDNCSSVLIKSISQSTFGCGDVGENTITLTVEDESGNVSTAEATVTVNSLFVDETVTTDANSNFCPDGSIATVSTGSSQVGLDYYLRDSEDNEVKDGPIEGTGSGLDFSTGNISSTTTFNVFAKLPADEHSALDFDGSNDKVVTPYIPPATNTLTIELWMKPSKTTYSRVVSSYQGSSSVLAGELAIDTYDAAANNGKALRFIVSGAGNSTFSFGVPNVLTLNEWNHVATVFDNGVIKLYVDGALVGTSGTASYSSLPLSASALTIGEDRIQGPNAEYFLGQMDDIRIWKVAKTVEEISSGMNQCLGDDEEGLELHYDFDENSGLTTTDLAGSNDGTLTNMDAASDWVTSDVEIACGNICEYQMTTEITIGDTENPVAIAQDMTVQMDATGNASINASDINNGSSDNCTVSESLIFSLDQTDFTCADLGTNIITLTVEDTNGNQSTTTATVTLEDTSLPVISAQNVTIDLDESGSATLTVEDVDTGTADNCTAYEDLILDLSQISFSCSDIGVNSVDYIVEDESGNQASTVVSVTVQDIQAPVVTTQELTLQLDENGIASPNGFNSIMSNVNDNCATLNDLTVVWSQDDFDCSDIGANIINVTVSDASGNSTIESATVYIEDNVIPSVLTQNITVNLEGNPSVSIVSSDVDNGSSDGCGIASYTLNQTTFTEANLGENTVTLTVIDVNGNQNSATAIVTVLDKLEQLITFNTLADKTYGDADIQLSATASSTLSVAFAVISGPASIDANTMSLIGAGTVVIEATQIGDETYAVAPAVQTSFEVTPATLTVSADNLSTTYGDTTPIPTLTYAGFIGVDSETDLISVPTIEIVQAGSEEAMSRGSSTLAKSLDSPLLNAGSYDLVMTGGEANDYVFTLVDGILTVNKADQTITADPISDLTTEDDETVTVVASASSGLALSYAVSGPATLSGNSISLTGLPGTVTVTISQVGNINYNAAPEVSVSFEVIDQCADLVVQVAEILQVQCFGDASGQISLAVQGGLEPYTYDWSNGATGSVASNLSMGFYSVVVTDANGCTSSMEGGVEQPTAALSATATLSGNTVEVSVTGGTAPYSYSLAGETFASSNVFNGLAQGSYTVTVVDANGCSIESNSVQVVVAGVEEILSYSLYPNPVVEYLHIDNISSITLYDVSGQTVLEGSGASRLDLRNLKSGVYLIKATDLKGRSIQDRIVKR